MSTSEKPRLLSVEEHSETRLVLKLVLNDSCEVSSASDIEEALDAISSQDLDLLLLDINLGAGKSGTELLHAVRNREDINDVPAVALTAHAMPGAREDLLDNGFDGSVRRPFTKDKLSTAIDQTLSAT